MEWLAGVQTPVWARACTVLSTGVPLFIRLTIFDSIFDQLKLQISYGNMKFGQNKSCRGKEDLQVLFWAKVDLELESMIKMRLKTAKKMFTKRT